MLLTTAGVGVEDGTWREEQQPVLSAASQRDVQAEYVPREIPLTFRDIPPIFRRPCQFQTGNARHQHRRE